MHEQQFAMVLKQREESRSREPDKYLEDLKEWCKLVRKILSHVVMSRLGKEHCVAFALHCQIFYGLFIFFSENM